MDFPTTLMTNVWIIPAIMAGSFLVILFVGKRLPETGRAAIGIAAVGLCFLLSCITAFGWVERVNDHSDGQQVVACGNEEFQQPLYAGLEMSEALEVEADESIAESLESEGAFAPMVGESAAPALAAAEEEYGSPTPPVVCSLTWFESGASGDGSALKFEIGTYVDGLSVMMLFTVTLISLLVHIFSTAYLHGDRRHTHYFAFLSLFTAAMLFYVLSSNTLQMLMGWELVGVCSFALIGHWWEERKNSDAALKAFMTNRVGDMGLLIGIIILFFAAGGTSFGVLHLNEYALGGDVDTTLLLIGSLCLFAGVTSKSGQFPLHTWLPDAMAGPTPVSALIHAATMVVAGVYLIARLYPVFWAGLEIGGSQIHYVALIGGLTTLVGASLAFVQTDLKKVLAYSTISQLGFMVMALGVGAWTAGVFHLFTHAFFKAALFLGAGSVSHACHHTFDMREMGGLRKKMPITHGTFLICTLALAGIVPFAGFWSKDEILAGAAAGQGAGAYHLMLVMGMITAFLTAAYMGRAYWMTFWGEYRGHAHPHESPKVMTVPLIILAVFATFAGIINFPWYTFEGIGIGAHWFEDMVQPTFLFPSELEVASFNPIIALVSVALAGAGLALAFFYYQADLGKGLRGLTQRNAVAGAGYRLLENKYYLDAIYDGLGELMRGSFARASYWVNQNIIDKIVNAVGVGSRESGSLLYRFVDQGVVDTVVNSTGAGSEESGEVLSKVQTGKVQQYGALLFGGAVVLGIVFVVVTAIVNG